MTKPITNLFFITTLILLLASCKVAEKDITGIYSLENFPKTRIQINSDKTFEFAKINRNPYLLPYEHPDENYFITKGRWTRIENRSIELTSSTDTLIYPLININLQKARDSTLSYFTFYDSYGDTVKILYVQLPNNSIEARMHSSMDDFRKPLLGQDTLEFHFYGYRPWKFINAQKQNADYSITLAPEFRPGFFYKTEFRVKRKKMIDVQRHGKFRQKKSNIVI